MAGSFTHFIRSLIFFASTRSWFGETHPTVAKRFLPFIDWVNGDGMGYLVLDNGTIADGLFCFEHELFEHDEDQDPDEFIVKWNNSIFELLTEGAGIFG